MAHHRRLYRRIPCMPPSRLIHASHAVEAPRPEDLEQVLATSRSNNARVAVAGAFASRRMSGGSAAALPGDQRSPPGDAVRGVRPR
jgi:hypothetical protein